MVCLETGPQVLFDLFEQVVTLFHAPVARDQHVDRNEGPWPAWRVLGRGTGCRHLESAGTWLTFWFVFGQGLVHQPDIESETRPATFRCDDVGGDHERDD